MAYQLDNIRFHYASKQVLCIKSLQIQRNVCTAILGANGAGKTTLLSLLSFVQQPSQGQLALHGIISTKSNNLALRRRVAALQQRPYLFRGSVLDNAMLGLTLRGINTSSAKHKALKALQQVNMAQMAGRTARTLSGGEAQRVALARCLAIDPEVLLLDEPFSHLDQATADQIEQVIQHYIHSQQGTVVFSTHDEQRWQRLAEQIVSLEKGRVIQRSPVNQLSGCSQSGYFVTGNIKIKLPDTLKEKNLIQLTIDPLRIQLSTTQIGNLENQFQARIHALKEIRFYTNISLKLKTIQLQAWIPADQRLAFQPGDSIWIHINPTAIQ